MSSLINWQVAEGRTHEVAELTRGTDAHPFARYVFLVYGPRRAGR